MKREHGDGERLASVNRLAGSGRFSEALAECCRERAGLSRTALFEVDLTRAELLEKTGSIAEARQALHQLAAHPRRSAVQEGRLASLNAAVQLHYGQRSQALASYRRAVSVLRTAGDDHLLWHAQLRVLALRGTRAESGEVGIDSATERAILATGFPTLAAAFHIVCCEVLAQDGLAVESAAHLAHAETILVGFDNPWLAGLVHLNNGCHGLLRGDLEGALGSALEALRLSAVSGHHATKCAAAVNIGATYLALGQVERAKHVLQVACEYARPGTALQALASETLAETFLATKRVSECSALLEATRRQMEQGGFQFSAWHADWSLATRARLRALLHGSDASVGGALPSREARSAKGSMVSQRLRLLDVAHLRKSDTAAAAKCLAQLSLSTPLATAGIAGQYVVGSATVSTTTPEHRGRLLRLGLLVLSESGEITDFVDCVSEYSAYVRGINCLRRSGEWHCCTSRRAVRVTVALDKSTELGVGQGAYCSLPEIMRVARFRDQHPDLVGELALRYLVGRGHLVRGALILERTDGTKQPLVMYEWPSHELPSDSENGTSVSIDAADGGRCRLRVVTDDSLLAADDVQSLAFVVQAALRDERQADDAPRAVVGSPVSMSGALFASPSMLGLLSVARRMAASEGNVLITGESGSGKDVIATYVHESSRRSSREMVPFNCSTVPRDMIDSQLFGHRKGAFTGASESFTGVIRAADGSTLFLDEVGDLPIDVQPKLLRFLDTGEVLPLGEVKATRVDVRVIAATNADLEELVAAGRFRRDLYYRLNILRMHVPPLRERPEDLDLILRTFIDRYKRKMCKPRLEFSEAALSLLCMYDWPGNVRQLDAEVLRMVAVYDDGHLVRPQDLNRDIAQGWMRRAPARQIVDEVSSRNDLLETRRRGAERSLVESVLAEEHGNMAAAARRLGVSRKGLYLIKRRLGIDAPDYTGT